LTYKQYILKRKIEDFLIFPFIIIGRLIASVKPLKKEYKTYFFFPFYHTGGAEKVHSLVAQATGGQDCIIFFTRKSQDNNFYDDFVESNCTIKDISKFTDNKFIYFINLIYRGIITAYINKQKQKPLIFNGQCNFGYKISPWVKKQIPQVELIHSYNTFSWIRIPFLPFIKKTIMISRLRIEDHYRQYDKINIPATYKSRIQYIVNGIPIPQQIPQKQYDGELEVLYVGRATKEKRVHLIAKMAMEASLQKLPFKFVFMGDVKSAIAEAEAQYCTFYGHINNATKIDEIYNKTHVVIITSDTEGFPMVIEEGMARACAVLATPVGDIPVHVINNENGFLFSSVTDDALIVKEGINFLTLLSNDRKLLQDIGERNQEYAVQHFSIEAFNQSYQQLFKQLSSE
jgi:glycosyltransferase involved in cell wall biosynthesis